MTEMFDVADAFCRAERLLSHGPHARASARSTTGCSASWSTSSTVRRARPWDGDPGRRRRPPAGSGDARPLRAVDLLLVAAGGAVGAVLRHARRRRRARHAVPWPTLAINVVGAFVARACCPSSPSYAVARVAAALGPGPPGWLHDGVGLGRADARPRRRWPRRASPAPTSRSPSPPGCPPPRSASTCPAAPSPRRHSVSTRDRAPRRPRRRGGRSAALRRRARARRRVPRGMLAGQHRRLGAVRAVRRAVARRGRVGAARRPASAAASRRSRPSPCRPSSVRRGRPPAYVVATTVLAVGGLRPRLGGRRRLS